MLPSLFDKMDDKMVSLTVKSIDDKFARDVENIKASNNATRPTSSLARRLSEHIQASELRIPKHQKSFSQVSLRQAKNAKLPPPKWLLEQMDINRHIDKDFKSKFDSSVKIRKKEIVKMQHEMVKQQLNRMNTPDRWTSNVKNHSLYRSASQ